MPAKLYEIEGQSYVRVEAEAVGRAAREKGLGAPALRLRCGREKYGKS